MGVFRSPSVLRRRRVAPSSPEKNKEVGASGVAWDMHDEANAKKEAEVDWLLAVEAEAEAKAVAAAAAAAAEADEPGAEEAALVEVEVEPAAEEFDVMLAHEQALADERAAERRSLKKVRV